MTRVFGGIMIAFGILVAGASGLCSVLFLGPTGEWQATRHWKW